MKRVITKILILILGLLLAACTKTGGTQQVLKVGATPVPHVDLLEFARPKLAEHGIKLEIVEFSDYITPNMSLGEGSTDANLFQHLPYMENFASEHDLDLVALGRVNLTPMGLYSNKVKSLEAIENGWTLSLPNDPVNEARALIFLEINGVLKLAEGVELKASVEDVVENPYELKFEPIDAAQLPRSLDDVDLAIIPGNYALGAGISPLEEALILEDERSFFPNVLATRKELKDDERLEILINILQSKDMVEFMKEKYEGAVIPGFTIE